jgi:hypothetical protein
MKPIEEIVPSFEVCKLLKKMGFKQDTYFFFRQNPIKQYQLTNATSYKFDEQICISAPMLSDIPYDKDYFIVQSTKGWHCLDINQPLGPSIKDLEVFETELDARITLWIYLNENKS